MSIPLTVLVTLTLLANIEAHSWLRCTDYTGTISGYDYDEAQCKAWIRDWQFDDVLFGLDRGIDHLPTLGDGSQLCKNPLNGSPANGYSADYAGKKAFYEAGQSVTLIHPAKNHANYECFNFIPDTEMKLYMNPNVNPTSDLPNTASTMEANGYVLIRDWHDNCTPGTDGCGFQDCPNFGPPGDCQQTDKAVCKQDFIVPRVAQSGYYTFVWYWVFNIGQLYVSCWEAYIHADGSPVSPITNPPTPPTPPPVPTSPASPPTPPPASTPASGGGNNGPITVVIHPATLKYYLRFQLQNVDASGCDEVVDETQILDPHNQWRLNDQNHHDNYFAYDYDGDITFDQFLPISVKIIMNTTREIVLSDIITDLNEFSVFTSTQDIC